MADVVRSARRIVVKVGSSLVTNDGRGVDADAIGTWCRQLAALAAQGREVVMVSSGAIAEESEPETAVSGNFANALDDGEDERPSTLLWPEGFDTAQVSEEPETAIAPDASPPST